MFLRDLLCLCFDTNSCMLRCHVCTAVHILLAINCFYICCVYKVDVIVISALTIKVSVKLIEDLLFILISLTVSATFLSNNHFSFSEASTNSILRHINVSK